ncbi:metal-dependent hydrolase [Candidatus Micrarchaeota archaeon]|nr:metal-dependent hydrolase [Candidatus Micrarchaeota archaeon]
MLGRTHVLLAILFFSPLLYAYHAEGAVDKYGALLILTGIAIGVLLPDVDSDESLLNRGGRNAARAAASGFGIVTKVFFFYPLVGVLYLAGERKALRHRGVFHSIAGVFLASLFWAAVFHALDYVRAVPAQYSMLLVEGMFLGALLHLYHDSLTKAGIEWLYPRPGRFSGRITTGLRGVAGMLNFFQSHEFVEVLFILLAAAVASLVVFAGASALAAAIASAFGLLLIAALCGVEGDEIPRDYAPQMGRGKSHYGRDGKWDFNGRDGGIFDA